MLGEPLIVETSLPLPPPPRVVMSASAASSTVHAASEDDERGDDHESDSLLERGDDESDFMPPRARTASWLSPLPATSRLTAACGGFVGGIVLSWLVVLALTPSLLPSPSPASDRAWTSPTARLLLDWVPAQQPLLHDRLRWLDGVLPLDHQYAIQRSPDLQLAALSDTANVTSDPSKGALRSFFSNYTRFHAQSMRSLGPDTKFVISRARDYYQQGMGNRMLAVASAFLLAALTDRVLIVDWTRHSEDGFDLGDVFEQPPIEWHISHIEKHYGAEAVLGAEGQAANYVTSTENWDSSKATYETLLCGDVERWRGSSSPQVVLVDSNQFFAPLLWHNPQLRERLEAWGFSNGQLGVWVIRYLFRPVAAVRQQMDEFKAQHWRPYMIGVQLRTRDGHATSEEITSLAYRCALFLTDALPLAWKQSGHIGWFLATDDEKTREIGSTILSNFHRSTGLPAPDIVYAPCSSAVGVSEKVAQFRCAVMHMALLGEVDDLVASKASTFGDLGHVMSGLAPMVLTQQLTCLRQPAADPCFHHWHYVRRLECFAAKTIRSASLEDINGRCIGEGTNGWS